MNIIIRIENMAKTKISFLTDRMILGHGVDIVIDNIARELKKARISYQRLLQQFDETFTGHHDYEIYEIPRSLQKTPSSLKRR
jgi:hypothetical protein